MDKPNITKEQISNMLDIDIRTVKRHFKFLIENNIIERIGSNKGGHWMIKNRNT